MPTEPASIPHVLQQPISVDFIEKKLPEIDNTFKNLNARYDPALCRFVPANSPDGSGYGNLHSPAPETKDRTRYRGDELLGKIFIPSKSAFLARTPIIPQKLQDRPEYSIRELGTWNEIYERLQSARVKYDSNKSMFLGRIKNGMRCLVDGNLVIAQRLGKLIPDSDYVSPVKAALEIVLDAAQVASATRKKIVSAQDNERLTNVLSKVEIFLAMFPDDENIQDASIDLVVCILLAVEGVIAFFLSSMGHRAWSALVKGDGYQKPLLDTIREIETQSHILMKEANVSSMYKNSVGVSMILDGLDRVQIDQIRGQGHLDAIIDDSHLIVQQNRQVITIVGSLGAEIMNMTKELLDDRDKVLIRLLEEMQSEQRRENSDEQSDYSAIPSQSTSPMPQTFHNSASPYLSPNPTVPGFWVMPPYYEQRSYPPPALWPYPLSPAPTYLASCPQPQNTIVTGTWIKQLQMSGLDRRDIESIIEDGESIPLHYRSSAKDIIQAEEFRCWIAALNSTELLVLGNPGMDSRDAFLAISLVCAHLTQSVRQRGHGYLALAFFCSQHMDGDDAHASPHALMQSLLCQLLEQQQQNAHSHLLWNPRMQEAVEKGENLPILCVRFQGLVRQLPWDRTVMVVIDGASCYETERYETDMQVALSCLLGLARDPEVGPTFKVMVTCSTRTVSFHRLFAAQHAPLMLESLLPLGEDLDGFELHQDF